MAQERGEPVGSTVGYRVRGATAAGPATRLTFCTTGVLLRQLLADPDLAGASHLVIDEVHERSALGRAAQSHRGMWWKCLVPCFP